MTFDGVAFEWLMGGGMLAVVGFSLATYRQISTVKDDVEKKRARIYERIDEVKKANDDKFVGKEVCKILHEQTADDIAEIKSDVKSLLKKNGI